MSIVHGVIFKVSTGGKARFVTPSGRMYMWAYGAWRFKHQFVDSTYKLLRSTVGKKGSNVFLASSREVFMDKRIALEPIDYQAVDFMGRRLSKDRLLRKGHVARIQQNAAVAYGKETHQRLTGSAYCITPTPFYSHKMRPPKKHDLF